MSINKILFGGVVSLSLIVMGEICYLRFLSIKKPAKLTNAVNGSIMKTSLTQTPVKTQEKQIAICQTEESLSCQNWFTRYKHIDSTETITRGTFNGFESNKVSQEVRVLLTDKAEAYFVSYMKDVTKVTLQDISGKPIKENELKKGDILKITEKYQKNKDSTEEFSVKIVREK